MGDTDHEPKNATPTLDQSSRAVTGHDVALPKRPRDLQGSHAAATAHTAHLKAPPNANANKSLGDKQQGSVVAAEPTGPTDARQTEGLIHVVMMTFLNKVDALQAGLIHAKDVADSPEFEDDVPFLEKLIEIALDAAIAGSAEGLAIMAIEAIAAHAVTHGEALQEAVKVTLEGSAHAVMGKNDGRTVDTKALKNEFFRIADVQRFDFRSRVNDNWPVVEHVIETLPAAAVASVLHGLNSIPGNLLDARFQLQYLTSWMNFLACAKHGHRPKPRSPEHKLQGALDVDPAGVGLWNTDGSFQRPPELHGVLEVTLYEDSGMVCLANVGREARNALRRIGRPGAFPSLTLRDLKMNMLVRQGDWGKMTTELVVGPEGDILNRTHPPPFPSELKLVRRAQALPVSWIRRDKDDDDHAK